MIALWDNEMEIEAIERVATLLPKHINLKGNMTFVCMKKKILDEYANLKCWKIKLKIKK